MRIFFALIGLGAVSCATAPELAERTSPTAEAYSAVTAESAEAEVRSDEDRSERDEEIVSTEQGPLGEALREEAAGLFEEKIVGGVDALPGEDPWQVALVAGAHPDTNIVFCGGSLIAQRWVLTAAHCVDRGMKPAQVDVVSGTVDLDRGGARTRVKRIIVHPGWDRPSHNNDIALLELEGNSLAKPIALATAASEPLLLRGDLRVTGWGRIIEGGQKVRKLRAVSVPFVDENDCNNRVAYNGDITHLMLCAGRQEGEKDACQADSGGPLTSRSAGTPVLAGVVSWGRGCARRNKYGVYARVSALLPWISRCMAGQGCDRID